MARTKVNLDAINNAPPKEVALASFEIINALQNHYDRPHVQAAAACAVFLVLCQQVRIEPQTIFTAVSNILSDEREGGRDEFEALRMYVANEIIK